MNLAAVVFTTEEIAAIAQAAVTFSALIEKIKVASPDAWAAVLGDFSAARDAWTGAAINPVTVAAVTVAPTAQGTVYADAGEHVQAAPAPVIEHVINPDVQAAVERSGQLPGMPVESGNLSLDPPNVADQEKALAEGIAALGVTTEQVTPRPAENAETVSLAGQLAAARALIAAHPADPSLL
jgi:hypothetical protein